MFFVVREQEVEGSNPFAPTTSNLPRHCFTLSVADLAAASRGIVSTSADVNLPIGHGRNRELHGISCRVASDHAAVPEFGSKVSCIVCVQNCGASSRSGRGPVIAGVDYPNDTIRIAV